MDSNDEEAPEPAEVGPEELKLKLEEERKRSEELLTRLKYAQADLENYRKRMDRELKEARESTARNLISKLLVVQDELDLAVRHSEGKQPGAGIREGVGMVKRNLESALESAGVERIECLGRPFDPTLHEAVERVQGRGEGEDMVVEEIRPGYLFRGQLLRPSMVKVELARRAASQEAKAD